MRKLVPMRKLVSILDIGQRRTYTYECAAYTTNGPLIIFDAPVLVEVRHANGLSDHPVRPRSVPAWGCAMLGPGWYAWEVNQ